MAAPSLVGDLASSYHTVSPNVPSIMDAGKMNSWNQKRGRMQYSCGGARRENSG